MKIAALLAAAIMLVAPAFGQEDKPDTWLHGSSAIGAPKYPDGFAHFDYVNVDAPKGGVVRMGAMGGFDTFNPILPKGEAAGGLGLIYETLMTPSQDEVLTDYGLLAEAM